MNLQGSRIRSMVAAACTLAALALTTGSARAATETFQVAIPTMTTDFTTTVSLPGFNPALGSLTAVSLSLEAVGSQSGSVKNNASGSETFTPFASSLITATGPNSSTNTATLSSSQTFTLASGASTTYGPFTPASNTASNVSTTGYTSAGNISVTVSTSTSQGVSGGGGNIVFSLMTTAGGSADVTYTYTPATTGVPEPSSCALAALGGLGLVGYGWRRSRKARTVA